MYPPSSAGPPGDPGTAPPPGTPQPGGAYPPAYQPGAPAAPYQQAGPAAPGPAYQPVPPESAPPAWIAAPARPRRSPSFWVLLGLSIVLAVALLGTVVGGLVAINGARHDLNTVRAQRDALAAQDSAAVAKQQDDLRSADLAGKFQQVKDLDKATDSAYSQWKNGSSKYGTLAKAISDCENAVDVYDRAAAPFPASMLPSGLPPKINTDNPETDCGRAFTGQI